MQQTNGRMDIATRRCLPKEALFRLVCVDGEIILDEKQSMKGRGVYLSKSKESLALAKKKHCLRRAFPNANNEEEILLALEGKR